MMKLLRKLWNRLFQREHEPQTIIWHEAPDQFRWTYVALFNEQTGNRIGAYQFNEDGTMTDLDTGETIPVGEQPTLTII